ncbi:MAG: hypothetical protein VX438_13645, partial [Planctomycetota bacterium]|nr:hypothetical protein [Planctomycetota bacterium]
MSKRRASIKALITFFLAGLLTAPSIAEHPEAEKLLPEKTVFLLKIESIEEFTGSFMETGFMKMLQDEKIAPVVESLYGSVEDAYADAEAAIGVSLDELQTLLKGEACFAVVAQKNEPISFVLLADYQGNAETADKLLSLGETQAESSGADLDIEDVEGVEIREISGRNE